MRGNYDLSAAELIHRIKERQAYLTQKTMSTASPKEMREIWVWTNQGMEDVLSIIDRMLKSEDE